MATEKDGGRVRLVVSKWGNSLAVRLPAELAKQLGVGEGDTLIGEIISDRRLTLTAETRAVGKAEVRRMRKFLARQKMTAPVIDEMRRSVRKATTRSD